MKLSNHSPTWSAIVAAAFLGFGCSADSIEAPEPTMYTPGAFEARLAEPGRFELYRTLDGLKLENQKIWMFLTSYGKNFPSLEAAREHAKQTSPDTTGLLVTFLDDEFKSVPVTVVWFRTLTEAERDAYR